MTHFAIGQAGQHKLQVDLLKLVDTRMLIQSNSGGGKSWLLRLIAERIAGKVQIIILDPEGEFATLREKLDFALVGHGGEIATEVRTAALLARKLVELSVSAVVDLYDLDLSAKREFVSLFIDSLLAVPRSHWHPLLLMLDECHKFCPEKGDVESSRAVINLMDSGRKRGFAGLIATQRLSKLHKDAAAEANNVFIGRTWLDLDQERAGDLLGMRKADRGGLRDLQPGEFFAFGPALSVNGVTRFRSDQVITTHPRAGERHHLEVPKASEAIREIVQHLGDLPKQAEGERNELESARRRISDLERELRVRPVQVQPKVERIIERIEIPIFKDGEVGQLETSVQMLADVAAQFMAFGGQLKGAVSEVSTALRAAANRPAIPIPAPRPAMARPISIPMQQTAPTVHDTTHLPRAERCILTALAQYSQGRTKTQLAILAGYAVNGGGFGNAVGKLRSLGLLSGYKDFLTITPGGLEILGDAWEPLPQGRALIDHWLRELPKAERAILGVLVNIYPGSLNKAELAECAGYDAKGGGFGNAISRLRRLELIAGRDELRASDSFFIQEAA